MSQPIITMQTKERLTSTLVTWTINFKGITRTVRLSHGKVFGGRTIRVDEVVISKKRSIVDAGSTHHLLLTFGDQILQITIEIRVDGLNFSYHLLADTMHNFSSEDICL
jgi:hypothetical protein